jgi:AbrB family looped-hinge helix DNA binding protein
MVFVTTLSTKYQLVIPRDVRERLELEPGAKITVIEKGGILYLVPERPIAEMRGVARGARRRGLREKKDRL